MDNYSRQRDGFRYVFGGMNTRSQPDSLPPNKYPLAINVRAIGDSSLRTRPGCSLVFSGSGRITDFRAYTALGTDNLPRFLAHTNAGNVYLDTGTLVGTVGSGGPGASLIPFRPNASPNPWMYIANVTGYQKFSAPTAGNVVSQANVGIAEPQASPEAAPDGIAFTDFSSNAAGWTPGGTAGALSDVTRSTDTATAIFLDPASVSPAAKLRYSVQVGTGVQYQIGEELSFATGASPIVTVVEDVLPPVNAGSVLTIQAIRYSSGSTGRCVVVPSQIPVDPSVPSFSGNDPNAGTTFLPGQLSTLRRGALIQFAGGTPEVALVLSVTTGPDGTVAFECVTVNTHAAGEALNGEPAIVVSGITSAVIGQTITASAISFTNSTGIGTATQTLGTNPFNQTLGTGRTPQTDDYIHVSVLVSDITQLLEARVLFDVGDGSFTQNVLYYVARGNVLQQAISNLTTQLGAIQQQAQQQLVGGLGRTPIPSDIGAQPGIDSSGAVSDSGSGGGGGDQPTDPTASDTTSTGASQWTELIFPITALTRYGDDQTKTLANCGKVQLLINSTGSVTVNYGSVWVGGGGQPDVGQTNPPYLYRVRPRASATGALGNPSPTTRYGVFPTRQRVIVSLPSAAYDSQIDTWDIFRYGGTVTSWRYIGSASSTATTFVDDYFDDAALAGDLLAFDNYQPWPSVDVPYKATVGGNVTSITITGTALVIIASSFPSTIASWLPGTLVQLNGQQTYTLQVRPVAVSGGYLFRTIENMGAPTVTTLVVQEPRVAAQVLPYVWGPDANGVIYAAGDSLRPGTFQGSKQNAPDMVPDAAYDLTPPSEPLLGGEVIDGLALVASSERWWRLQAAFDLPQRWIPVESPSGRGLACPWGHCTDGKLVYFWAKDGIYAMSPSGAAVSLTDEDLFNLFPHDSVPGANVSYGGTTVYAPDYKRAAMFRLAMVNSVLRATYRDSNGAQRVLSLDLARTSAGTPRAAWCVDDYPAAVSPTIFYQPEQPASTLASTSTAYAQGYLAGANGGVYVESDLTNDAGTPITGTVATFEWDGGDATAQELWNDTLVDMIPVSGATATPMSRGSALAAATTIAASASRPTTAFPVPVGVYSNFCGLLVTWTDDFTQQSSPTTLILWQPQFVAASGVLTTQNWRTAATSHGLKGFQHVRQVSFAYASTAPVAFSIAVTDGNAPATVTLPSTSGARVKQIFPVGANKGLLFQYLAACPTGSLQVWLEDTEVLVGAWGRADSYSVFRGLVAQ